MFEHDDRRIAEPDQEQVGEVWLAHDIGLGGRQVAIKMMLPRMLTDAADLTRSRR